VTAVGTYSALEEHGFYWKMAKDTVCFESIVWRNENFKRGRKRTKLSTALLGICRSHTWNRLAERGWAFRTSHKTYRRLSEAEKQINWDFALLEWEDSLH
jgi:hypothetical protein